METVVSLFGVQPLRIGGVERFARELSVQLGQKGISSVLVFGGNPSDPVKQFLDLPNVKLEVIATLEASLWDSLPKVAEIFRRENPSIVHFHFVDFVGPLPWLSRMRGVEKVYFTAQGSHPEGFIPHRAAAWKRLAARAINAPLTDVFCASDFVRRSLLTADLAPLERVHRLYNAVELPPLNDRPERGFAFRRRFDIPLDQELVTQVSWLIPEKGVDDFLAAAKLVRSKRPKTHFAIVGNGEFLERYRALSRSMDLAGALTFTGMLDDPMRDGAYAASDVFCLPSRWQEAFGWVIAEAMAWGVPVAATSVGGIPEIVEDGQTGVLCQPGHPDQLAEKLLHLLDNSALRQEMGRAGRDRAARHFELHSNVAELLRHYGF
jgi:glycosyltransferase involved in cell wall biosynthesis